MPDGFLVIDKPAGITSHDVVSRVRRTFGMKRVGHTGTLDPFATGVLPIALGSGTKAIPFLDESLKEYQAVMRLGAATDTLDITGQIISEGDWRHVTAAMMAEMLTRFTGSITQMMFCQTQMIGVQHITWLVGCGGLQVIEPCLRIGTMEQGQSAPKMCFCQ